MKEPPGLASGEASPRTRAAAAGLCAHVAVREERARGRLPMRTRPRPLEEAPPP